MTALDWDRTQREKKAEADRDDLPLGAIVLESWIEGSTKKHQARPFSTVLAAVQAAWKGRPATISSDGVLSISMQGPYGPFVLKQRIRAHGAYVSAASWRAMKPHCS
jgi:hypothetical protein